MMDLKDFLYNKKIKQIDLVRDLNLDSARVSYWANRVMPIPEKHKDKISKYIGCSKKQLDEMTKKKNG